MMVGFDQFKKQKIRRLEDEKERWMDDWMVG
jgi:hypothetical protein